MVTTTNQQAAAQTAPGTSREERQRAQLEANLAQAEIAKRAEQQPGGGISQPIYKADSNSGPTWADTPAGRELRRQYEASGVVFSQTGQVLYNPADLGSREIETARAAEGLPPSSKLSGEISAQYQYKVSQAAGQQAVEYRSRIEQLDKIKATAQGEITREKAAIVNLQEMLEERIRRKDSQIGIDSLSNTIRDKQRQISDYETQIKNIEAAKVTLAKAARESIKTQQKQTALFYGEQSGKVTKGPVSIQNALGAKIEPTQAQPVKPQRMRAQSITGVKEKLFASPAFMQEAETYTRPPSFLGEIRKERPKAKTGVKEKLFASPAFMSYEEQKQKDLAKTLGATSTDFTVLLTEGIPPPKKTDKAFAVSLSEGAPPKPKELTQEQVNALTPQQYAVYRAQYDAYNRYVTAQTKAENVKILRENLRQLKSFVDEQKKAGIKSIVIVTESGEKRVPIGEAYLELQRTKNIKSVYIDSVVPDDYTIAGTIAAPVFVPEKRIIAASVEKQDPLSKALRGLEQYKAVVGPRGPIPQSEASIFYKEAVAGTALQIGSTAAFLAGGIISVKNFLLEPTKPISNVLQTEKEIPYIPETPPNVVIGGPITGIISGEKDFGKKATEQKLTELKQKLGPGKFAGTEIGAGLELLNPIKGAKIIKQNILDAKARISEFAKAAPKVETIPVQFVKREGAKILEPTKPYQQSKLRNLGFEEPPQIKLGVIPSEEKALRKSFEIPEPFVKEVGTIQGRKPVIPTRTPLEESERIRKLEAERLKSISKSEPVKPDPLYTPGVELRRAPEPKTFRVDEEAVFGADTAKGSQFIKESVELGQGIGGIAQPSKGPLGGIIIKEEIITRYKPETIPLGAATKTKISVPLGKAETKTITPFGEKTTVSLGEGKIEQIKTKPVEPKPETLIKIKPFKELEKGRTELDIVRGDIERLEKARLESIKGKPVEEVFGYNPAEFIPKTRAKQIRTYKVQTNQLIGKTENPLGEIFARQPETLIKEGTAAKPGIKDITKKAELEKKFPQLTQKKAFERSAEYAESVRVEYPFTGMEKKLGVGIGKRLPVRVKKIEDLNVYDLGRGKSFFVSRHTGESGLKRFTAPPKPPTDEGKGKQQLILEKPSKFTPQKVELGKGRVKVMAAGTGTVLAPAIPLTKAKADEENITNQTKTNQTEAIPANQTEIPPIIIAEEQPSQLEPQSITESRPDVFAAAQTTPSGLKYGLEAEQSRRSGLRIIPTTSVKITQREKQREAQSSPTPFGFPARQAQPGAFKQPQKEKSRSLFPSPQPLQPGLKTPTPFPLKQPELLIIRTPPRPPRLRGAPKFAPPIKTPGRRGSKKKKGDVFLGNASEEEIALSFNRTEIITGSKRVERQLKKDLQITREKTGRGEAKFTTQKTGSVLSKKKQSILFREKPKTVKRFQKKTGGFFYG